MELFALILLILFILAGFITVFFAAFDTLIVLIGAVLYASLTRFAIVSFKTIMIMVILYISGELLEYICVTVGIKKFGASNKAVIGAIIGGMLGAAAGLAIAGIGTVVGLFTGIFLGAFMMELVSKKDLIKAVKAGTGGVIGRLSLIAVKIVLICVMASVILVPVLRHYHLLK